jgi:uncharacterized membrane protein
MKDMLCILGAILGIAIAAWQLWGFMSQKAGVASYTGLVIAIIFIIIAMACGVMFLLGRVNKEEEIHITK